MRTKLIICGAAFVLTLLLPWPLALVPACVLAPLAAFLCAGVLREEFSDPDWEVRGSGDARSVCVEPELIIGSRRISAQVWLPLEEFPGERFRSKAGALPLSAAIALTQTEAATEPGAAYARLEEQAQWVTALGIVPENLRRLHPRMDEAVVSGFRGAVVREGSGQRAYFVGGPALVNICTAILDGRERPMRPADREQLSSSLPADCLCYATSAVADGKLSALTFLGAVRPVVRYGLSETALAAADSLHRLGLDILLSREHASALAAVHEIGIDWPEADGDPGTLIVRAAHPDSPDQPRDFSAPVRALRRLDRREKQRGLWAGFFGLILLAPALLCSDKWPLLLGLMTLCTGIAACTGLKVRLPVAASWKPWLLALLPAVLLPVILALFLPQLHAASQASAGAAMLLAEAAALALHFPLSVRRSDRFRPLITTGMVIAISAVLLLFITPGDLLALSFGGVSGALTGTAVLMLSRL